MYQSIPTNFQEFQGIQGFPLLTHITDSLYQISSHLIKDMTQVFTMSSSYLETRFRLQQFNTHLLILNNDLFASSLFYLILISQAQFNATQFLKLNKRSIM